MQLEKLKTKSKKRVGRGSGSGKGSHTSGRGMKGQKARSSNHILFEGLKTRKSLLIRLPLLRGKDKNKANPKPVVVNLDDLENLKESSTVNIELLIKEGIVNKKEAFSRGVKVLGNGKIEKKLKVSIPVSASARKAIEAAGGTIE